MIERKHLLTHADQVAVESKDDVYLNAKGARLYGQQRFAEAVEYYHLAAAMGNIDAISNLGYCYLYGREIPQDTSLALAYFKLAAAKGSPDAAYKLGDIHSRNKWGLEDKELSIYYYNLAAKYIIGPDWPLREDISYEDDLTAFPSLCFALARELTSSGGMVTNIPLSYQFLLHAKLGYEQELDHGFEMYRQAYENVLSLMKDPQYDVVRKK